MGPNMKAVGLWVLLIILFVFFYNFFSTSPAEPSQGREWLMPIIFILVLIAFIAFSGRGVRKGTQLNAEGTVLLARGRITAALEKFEAARPLLKKQWKGVIPFNVGVCQLELWQLDAAEREFTTAQNTRELAKEVQRLLPPRLALVAALRGDVKQATQRLDAARKLDPEEPLLVLVEGVLAARRQDWAQARSLLEGPTTHIFGGPSRGLRDALLAWSVERTTGEHRYVDPVTVFGEAATDNLRKFWPDLVGFLLERAGQRANY